MFYQVQVEFPYGFAHAVQALTFKPNERTVKNAFIKQSQLFPYLTCQKEQQASNKLKFSNFEG